LDDAHLFRREGEYWTIVLDGHVCRLKDAKGLRFISHLVDHPGREFHVLDLAAAVEGVGEAPTAAGKATLGEGQVASAGLGDAGAMLDDRAKASYRAKLEELAEDLDEAERFGDTERAARAREMIEFITDELTAAVGLGRRDRKAASHAERQRLRVTKAIKSSVAKLAECDPSVGRHFAISIKTGSFCSYTPDPDRPVTWTR
jgi:hypothetical protein